MPSKSKKPAKQSADDPDALKRLPDGGYRSGDGRFTVNQANGSWFLADHEMADDFGQPRVIGPMATLKDARVAIPRLRAEPIPLRKPIKQPPAKAKAAPAPKPETWLDGLEADDRKRAERIVRALEKEGLADADAVAQSFVEGKADTTRVAARVLRARLDALLADADGDVRTLVDEVLKLVADSGGRTARDLPGWALVGVDADGTLTEDRLDIG